MITASSMKKIDQEYQKELEDYLDKLIMDNLSNGVAEFELRTCSNSEDIRTWNAICKRHRRAEIFWPVINKYRMNGWIVILDRDEQKLQFGPRAIEEEDLHHWSMPHLVVCPFCDPSGYKIAELKKGQLIKTYWESEP